jgi:Sugar transport protein
MYVPYRKAYISGMNPLSFVTVFTIGELATCITLVLTLDGGTHAALFRSPQTRPMLFWLFLGGFVWVIGDLFQQFATKYLGIGRAIPLSNTNQLWGLAWGALVFGELAHSDTPHKLLVIGGSLVMIAGAVAVSTAVANEREHTFINDALLRECCRYGLNYDRIVAIYRGSTADKDSTVNDRRRWWDYAILLAGVSVFVYLGLCAKVPTLAMNFTWLWLLAAVLVASALAAGLALWKTTRFS